MIAWLPRPAGRLIRGALLSMAVSQAFSACGTSTGAVAVTAHPRTYTVDLDVPPSIGHKGEIQVSEYFPRKLRVHPGDTVIWRNVGLSGHHTVTFGANRQVIPVLYRVVGGGSLDTARVTLNNAVVWPCVAAGAHVSPELSHCPDAIPEGSATPTWDGTGYANSGVITRYFGNPLRNPDVRQFALHISANTESGVYRYYDEIEQHMEGLLEVVPDVTPTTSPAVVAARVPAEMNETVATIKAACTHEVVSMRHGSNNVVMAGCGTVAGSYNDFFPDRPVIHSGETLTWINGSGAVGDYHTVTLVPVADFEGAPFGTIPYVTPVCGTIEVTPPLNSLRCAATSGSQFKFPAPSSPARSRPSTGRRASHLAAPPSGRGPIVTTELNLAAAFSTLRSGAVYEPGGTSGFFPAPNPATPTTTYSLRFNRPGVYQFGCVLHPGMTGEVIVR